MLSFFFVANRLINNPALSHKVIHDGAAKSHFVVVQTSCLHKIGLQAGRLHHNIWIITVLFSLFAALSYMIPPLKFRID